MQRIDISKTLENRLAGGSKKGDLAFLRAYRFKMAKQLMLLGYSYEEGSVILELIALDPHDSFYHDLKKTF